MKIFYNDQGSSEPFVLCLLKMILAVDFMAKKMSWQAKQRAEDLKLASRKPKNRKEAQKQLEAKLRIFGMHQVEPVRYMDGITMKTEWK